MYRRIAGDIRDRIASGVYGPGKRIPAEKDFQAEYGVSRGTARKALDVVTYEGLVEVRHPYGRFVRQVSERRTFWLSSGNEVGARMPVERELDELDIDEATPVFEVTRDEDADGPTILATDGWRLRVR
jgi:DNA-binding transcriptional MocR family regulator